MDLYLPRLAIVLLRGSHTLSSAGPGPSWGMAMIGSGRNGAVLTTTGGDDGALLLIMPFPHCSIRSGRADAPAGSVQVTSCSTRDGAGLPWLSWAGVNRARERMIRQVAESSPGAPLGRVTLQALTRPSAPT